MISCGSEGSMYLTFKEGIDLQLTLDCAGTKITKASQLYKTLLKVIKRVTDASMVSKHQQAFANISYFEIYLHGDVANNSTLKNEIASILRKSFNSLRIPTEQLRIDFKVP